MCYLFSLHDLTPDVTGMLVNNLRFMDDLLHLNTPKTSMQNLLNIAAEVSSMLRFAFNVSKCKYIVDSNNSPVKIPPKAKPLKG